MPDIGERAPDFTLFDQDKVAFTLSLLQGRTVMLVFFPLAFSSTCTGELCAIRDDFRAYERRGATVIGVSVDSTYALGAWKREQGYQVRFLSDRWPLGEVIKLYGVWNEAKGYADRATFIVDPAGIVRYRVHNPPEQARDEAAYVVALDALGAGAR